MSCPPWPWASSTSRTRTASEHPPRRVRSWTSTPSCASSPRLARTLPQRAVNTTAAMPRGDENGRRTNTAPRATGSCSPTSSTPVRPQWSASRVPRAHWTRAPWPPASLSPISQCAWRMRQAPVGTTPCSALSLTARCARQTPRMSSPKSARPRMPASSATWSRSLADDGSTRPPRLSLHPIAPASSATARGRARSRERHRKPTRCGPRRPDRGRETAARRWFRLAEAEAWTV
mmetsp:Transcript_13534/g.40914  ORF Transcript_13534/g.40914 Transcript_13534/m.40914 type:complete len:233 (-) Transcript_13534:280-978(-)